MGKPLVLVRPCEEADWPAVWSILQSVAVAGDTIGYALDLSERSARDMWIAGAAKSQTFVAIDQAGGVAGSAVVGPNHDGPGSHVATATFIVAADARGLGVGRALVAAVLSWAKDQCFDALQFNAVAASNAAAIHLYTSEGFKVVGSIPDAFRHPILGDVPLLVMYRRL